MWAWRLARSGLALIQNDTSTSIVQSGGTITAGALVSRLDSLGRTVARGDLTLEYGPDGQVATARRGSSTWSFVHDEAGQRRLKAAKGTPVVAYLDEGYLDESGLSEPVSVGGRVVGLVRGGAFQTAGVDLRGTVFAEADLTPRIASPFGQRDVHPAVSAVIVRADSNRAALRYLERFIQDNGGMR